ncbi:MAG: RNA polymerase subunit sigma-70 [Gaiellaceae bacterium]
MHELPLPNGSERALVARARAGERDAFALLVGPHRRGLHLHCYRMVGSLHEAEDLLQETFLRAWRALARFEERSSVRAWLYRIATNACLDALKRRRRRILPDAYVEPADPDAVPEPAAAEVLWLEPYPDRLLDRDDDADPARRYEAREAIELTFVTAIQHLSPRQRAVLILRDALGFSARETAAMLESSLASVNGALHRARAAVERGGAQPGRREPTPAHERAALVRRYVRAWEAADIEALVALLREDARMTMPPTPSWYLGRAAIARFLAGFFAGEPGADTRLVATAANRQPALAVYSRGTEDAYRPLAIKVLTIDRGRIAAITGFTDPSLFPFFDLAPVAHFGGSVSTKRIASSSQPRSAAAVSSPAAAT